MSYLLKSKLYQTLQTLFSAVLLVMCLSATSQLAADFSFFEEADSIFTQLEINKPKIQNDLIDRSRSRTPPKAKIRFSLDQAASRARSQSGGTVIKARTSWQNGKPIHTIRVRVISNDKQRVKTYRYDGVSGRRL